MKSIESKPIRLVKPRMPVRADEMARLGRIARYMQRNKPVSGSAPEPVFGLFQVETEFTESVAASHTDGTNTGPVLVEIAKPPGLRGLTNAYEIGAQILGVRNVINGVGVGQLEWADMNIDKRCAA